MKKIFISYRREDSQDVTGRIYDHLSDKFGRQNIFKDVDSIPTGVDFRNHIKNAVKDATISLVIIGPKWLTSKNQEGKKRLFDSNDFVRIEIEHSIRNNIVTFPVLVGNTQLPDVNDLPKSIQDLVFKNAIRVRPDPDFHADIDRLSKAISKTLRSKKKPQKYFFWIFGLMIIIINLFIWSSYIFPPKKGTDEDEKDSTFRKQKDIVEEINLSDYYQDAFSRVGLDLKRSLARITRRDHRIITYREAYRYTADIHKDLQDSSKLRVFYDYKLVPVSNESIENSAIQWNRELIWPKTYGISDSQTALADLFNIVPADPSQNSERTNKAFTDVATEGKFLINVSQHGDIRGDLARILFYMAVRYEGIGNEPNLELTDESLVVEEPYFGSLSLLLRWHNEDGVSLSEKERNENIYRIQGNRNPFVDNPEFVQDIWGN